jgi:hypothetical protein
LAGLDVYVEHSNEVWSDDLAQAAYAEERGVSLGLSETATQAKLRYHSQRSVEIFDIWRSAWSGSSRIKGVLASQASNSWTGAEVMEWREAYESADALAIAPYFGGDLGDPDTQDEIAALSTDELLTRLTDSLSASAEYIQINADNAAINGLPLIAYGGGQHLVGTGGAEDNEALNTLFEAANRDPRMGELYRDHLDDWRSEGGSFFLAYSNVGSWNKSGYWGALEYQDQPIEDAPKFHALISFIRDQPRWWD